MWKKYWDEEHETMAESAMRSLQTSRIKDQLERVYHKIPFYRRLFDEAGVKPAEFRELSDIVKFPFTLKSDLVSNYPYGLCAVPLSDIVRIHASSGTTGKPSPGCYTAEDLDQWTECMSRALWAQEVRPDGVFQNANGMGLFTGGMGFHQAACRIGCAVVPTGTGMTERQLLVMQDFGTTAFTCTASYCFTILERAEKMGLDIRRLSLRTGHFGAEPWSQEMRREIERRSGIRAYEHYGLTELMGPGVAFNCEYYKLHINEDHVFPEIIDPVTLQPLEPGRQGELVFTALQRTAMPVIRYRTRDLSTLRREKCRCGRTLAVMDKVMGRTDDVMIISGVNVFPSQIESVLMEFDAVEPIYQIRLGKKGHRDAIRVETEAKPQAGRTEENAPEVLAARISERIHQVIGIKVPVSIVSCNAIPRSEGKAKRILDER